MFTDENPVSQGKKQCHWNTNVADILFGITIQETKAADLFHLQHCGFGCCTRSAQPVKDEISADFPLVCYKETKVPFFPLK